MKHGEAVVMRQSATCRFMRRSNTLTRGSGTIFLSALGSCTLMDRATLPHVYMVYSFG